MRAGGANSGRDLSVGDGRSCDQRDLGATSSRLVQDRGYGDGDQESADSQLWLQQPLPGAAQPNRLGRSDAARRPVAASARQMYSMEGL